MFFIGIIFPLIFIDRCTLGTGSYSIIALRAFQEFLIKQVFTTLYKACLADYHADRFKKYIY